MGTTRTQETRQWWTASTVHTGSVGRDPDLRHTRKFAFAAYAKPGSEQCAQKRSRGLATMMQFHRDPAVLSKPRGVAIGMRRIFCAATRLSCRYTISDKQAVAF